MSAPCELHNQRDCNCCCHAPGECGFGSCHDAATHTLTHEGGRDVRQFCTRHATHHSMAAWTVGYQVARGLK